MKKQLIWVFEWRKSVHYWWSYILFSPECKELTGMLDPLLYRWSVPPVVIRCVHWTMQMEVLQTWIKAQGLAIVMMYPLKNLARKGFKCNTMPMLDLPINGISYKSCYLNGEEDKHIEGRHAVDRWRWGAHWCVTRLKNKQNLIHGYVMTWKHFLHCWPFMGVNHQPMVYSPHIK